MRREQCSRKFDRFFRCFDPLSHHLTEAKRRMRTVWKSATFLATESVNSAPEGRKNVNVQMFGKENAKLFWERERERERERGLCTATSHHKNWWVPGDYFLKFWIHLYLMATLHKFCDFHFLPSGFVFFSHASNAGRVSFRAARSNV